jgi:hypothetical protein
MLGHRYSPLIDTTTNMSHDDLAIVDEEDDSARVPADQPQSNAPSLHTQLPSDFSSKESKIWYLVRHHLTRHAGAGVMASVAYFDP